MADIITMFAAYGITPVGVLGAAGTIAAAYFSARWGARETRRQFDIKTETERQAAAMELIPLLMTFANECDQKKYNLSAFINSMGHEGIDEPLSGIKLGPTIRSAAALLGPEIGRRTVKLEITKTRAESYVSNVYIEDIEDKQELDEQILSFFALLSLRARWIVDMAAKAAGLAISHDPEELERLLAEATKHSFEIESGDELRWY